MARLAELVGQRSRAFGERPLAFDHGPFNGRLFNTRAEVVQQVDYQGQVGKAAEVLGVSRPTVYHLLKKYEIEV